MKLFFRVFLFMQLITLSLQAQYRVQGVVTDSLTKEPLAYTSVYLKGTTEGGMTDDEGHFSFKTYCPEGTLIISAVGSHEYARLIYPERDLRLRVALSPATYALNEVVIKPKRERYKKKDNPAVEFVRQMIEHRPPICPTSASATICSVFTSPFTAICEATLIVASTVTSNYHSRHKHTLQ